MHRHHHRPVARLPRAAGRRTSRSSSMCHHKAPHRPWQPDEKYRARCRRTCRCPSRRRSTTTTPAAPTLPREATMRIDRDLTDERPEGAAAAGPVAGRRSRSGSISATCATTSPASPRSTTTSAGCSITSNATAWRDNTIVIYTSDQGFFLGDHDWYDKRFMYEESLRMPFLVRWPGLIKPGTVDERDGPERRFRADAARRRRRRRCRPTCRAAASCRCCRAKTPKDWRTAMYYRYYHYPRHHHVAAALRRPHGAAQADLLQQARPVGALRSRDRSARTEEPLRRSGAGGNGQALKAEMEALKQQLGDKDQFANALPADDVG